MENSLSASVLWHSHISLNRNTSVSSRGSRLGLTRKAKEVTTLNNKTIMKGEIRNGEDMIPFKIVWVINLDIYRLHCDSPVSDSPDEGFTNAKEALDFLYDNFGNWWA